MNGRFAANLIDDLYERIANMEDDHERLAEEREAYRETVLFLARCLGKALAERDRARATAVFLEQLIAGE